MKKIELLAPAGDMEKLKMAILYGADAVYVAGENFGLRTASKNFSDEELVEAVKFVHDRNKKIFVTANIIPHNEDFDGLEEYLIHLEKIGIDAIIVADPGLLFIAKQVVPNMEIHWSTQANNTNYNSAKFWYNQGVQRVVTARELSFEEIKKIREEIPQDMDIESFVHGAMCISYSGRCLISNYMTDRDANRGACSHPCRWNYALVEEKRPGEYFPIEEDERGTYFFNSKDLCMIEYVKELIEAGVTSFKIEGRVKTPYYVATIVRAYRAAIDQYYSDPQNYTFNPQLMEEVMKASYRDFTTGFYNDKAKGDAQNYGSSSYIRNYDFMGLVLEYDETTNLAKVDIRNRTFVGDMVEIIGPHHDTIFTQIKEMYNKDMEPMEVAPRPKEQVWINFGVKVDENFIIRKKAVKKGEPLI